MGRLLTFSCAALLFFYDAFLGWGDSEAVAGEAADPFGGEAAGAVVGEVADPVGEEPAGAAVGDLAVPEAGEATEASA